MARVILITTRHIAVALGSSLVRSIASHNYHSVFFRADEKNKSALSEYIIEHESFVNKFNAEYGIAKNDIVYNLYESLSNKKPEEIGELFEKLLAGDNINLLKHNTSSEDNIEVVRKGVQRINDTNIFVCHEWFSDKISNASSPEFVERTRIAYLKAIIDDIKCEMDGDEKIDSWVLLSHDEDFGMRGHDEKLDLSNELYKSLGLEKEMCSVWIFKHSGDSVIYKELIEKKNFDHLMGSTDIDQTMQELIHPSTPETCLGEPYEIIKWSEKITQETVIDWIANLQRTGKRETTNLKKNTSRGEIEIEGQDYMKDESKPIIFFGEGIPLSDIKDNRKKYLDSSIWLRYADTKMQLEELKAEVRNNSDLYKTGNAIEIKEFKARMALNSFLVEVNRDHYQHVYPFIFHSETEMKRRTDKEEGVKYKICQIKETKQIKWRILIVDDNAFIDDPAKIGKSVDKCKIISSILSRDFKLICDNINNKECKKCKYCLKQHQGEIKESDICTEEQYKDKKFVPDIYLDCTRSVEEVHKKLEEKRYDIVLLDYLFKEQGKFKAYGTKLLEDICNGRLNKQCQGPYGKLWFFFISAFPNAISEKMLSDGMHYNTDYWYIARGACPTTTPELFRYNLLSLMKHQLDSITDIKVSTDENYPGNIRTLVDLLKYIYSDKERTRLRAMTNFDSLLHLRAHYNLLKKDYYYIAGEEITKQNKDKAFQNGSPLVQSLFPDAAEYSNSFWEHTQHLVYLTAFGTVLQWPEMWEEYTFIKDRLDNADKNKFVSQLIKSYIISIKNN